MIRVTCGSCEKDLYVRERHRGREGVCPRCGAKMIIGGTEEALVVTSGVEKILERRRQNQASLEVECGHCGRELRVRQRHRGKSGTCPGCGATILLTDEGIETEPPSEEVMAELAEARRRVKARRRRRRLLLVLVPIVVALVLLLPRLWPEETRIVEAPPPEDRRELAVILEAEEPTYGEIGSFEGLVNHVTSVVVARAATAPEPEAGTESPDPGGPPRMVLSGFDVYLAFHPPLLDDSRWAGFRRELDNLEHELKNEGIRRTADLRARLEERRVALLRSYRALAPRRVVYVKINSRILDDGVFPALRKRYEPEARSMVSGAVTGAMSGIVRPGSRDIRARARADLERYRAFAYEDIYAELTVENGRVAPVPEWLARRVKAGHPDAEIVALIVLLDDTE